MKISLKLKVCNSNANRTSHTNIIQYSIGVGEWNHLAVIFFPDFDHSQPMHLIKIHMWISFNYDSLLQDIDLYRIPLFTFADRFHYVVLCSSAIEMFRSIQQMNWNGSGGNCMTREYIWHQTKQCSAFRVFTFWFVSYAFDFHFASWKCRQR